MATRAALPMIEQYAAFAQVYDRLIGNIWFPQIRRAFEGALRRYGVRFRSAADLGCGTGTFVEYLSRRGIPVFGVDRSPEMLAIAAAKNAGRPVRLLQQDLRAFELPHPVDLLTCNFDTLNYLLSARDLAAAFARCRAHLRPGGHLLFDMLVRPRSPERGRATWRPAVPPGMSALWTARWSAPRGLSVVTMRFALPGPEGAARTRTEVHVQRWPPLSRVLGLLRRTGLAVLGARDMDRSRPPTPATSWVQVVARRGTGR